MPEYPDLTLYVEALARLAVSSTLESIRITSPTLLRSVYPPPATAEGRRVVGARRLAKRVVIELEGELFLVFHLMVTGRFRWRPQGARPPRRGGLAAFDFSSGCLLLGEAGTKRRASLHLVQGEEGLAAHDPGGLEVMGILLEPFAEVLTRENHTLKRALTDPRLFAAIGNAYSDEILHRAQLSPVRMTRKLQAEEVARLHAAVQSTLSEWTQRLREELGDGFPEKVTAFHEEMAVHGRHRQPCPVCGDPVQRIVYASNQTNYCATCQTGGVVLADRALSRLLKRDWPCSLDELERRRPGKSWPEGRAGNPASRPKAGAQRSEAERSQTGRREARARACPPLRPCASGAGAGWNPNSRSRSWPPGPWTSPSGPPGPEAGRSWDCARPPC
jgi:formamidopyrimidine-DNA glycosylase